MNHIQVIGTHNSYHVVPSAELIKAAMMFDKGAAGWNYSHPPLPEQLDLGVRSFEIDLSLVDGVIKVFHVPHLDEGSTCPTFRECLQQVLGWSRKHPRHLPISFLLEIKDDYANWHKGMSAWDAAGLDQLDAEIREVFEEKSLITPDVVRGSHATLEEGVLAGNWPTLEVSRGTVLFLLHEQGRLRDIYLEHRPSAEGRVCFPRSRPGESFSAFVVADGPEEPNIPLWVKQGYYVRTRADSGLVRDLDRAAKRRQLAFESGAHIVSTDYPPGKPDGATGYVVDFEGKGARCNPVASSPECSTVE